MTRTLFIFLFSLASFAVLAPRAATAGDYSYRGDYSRYDRPYNSTCCYRRVVRYERIYRDYDRSYYRGSSYGSPYYENGSYVTSHSYERPYRYDSYRSYSYPASHYYSGNDYDYSARYSYDQPRRFYTGGCYPRRYRVYDDQGGWVWGSRSVCN
jgi:hypothetical protein